MANTFVKIAEVTVGAGGASSIDFTSIPSTYTDLCLKVSTRTNINDTTFTLIFNNNTSSYSWRRLLTYVAAPTAGTAASDNSTSASNIAVDSTVPSPYTASTFGNAEFYIPNYAGSTNKSVSYDGVTENNATQSLLFFVAGLWSNTAAVNQITLKPGSGGNFVQYSTAYLYGISKS